MTSSPATEKLQTAHAHVLSTELSHCVVVQEPAYLSRSHHNSELWATLGSAQPDYEALREELRLLGGRLVW